MNQMKGVACVGAMTAITALLVGSIKDEHITFAANKEINVQTGTTQDQECEYAGGTFGYRRCADGFLTVGFIKDLLRKVWSKKITFIRLDIDHPELLPVGPRTVVRDNIGFKRTR